MFNKSVSPSWTYIAIVSKVCMGHEFIQFTLPSNQTQYQNNNHDALLYFVSNLNNIENKVEGCIANEDFDPIPRRLGISEALAYKLKLERQQKFDQEVKKYSGVDFAKSKDKLAFEEWLNELNINKENEDNSFDELFDSIFNSPEFQKKYEALIQTFALDVAKSMLIKEIDKVLSVEYIKKSDL